MSANVHCAGQLYAVEQANGPCGWKGERAKTWDAPTGYERAATTKPCPRCGGRVELIDPEDKP
jgi:hypothetical protein